MFDPKDVHVLILAGGKGARFDHETQVVPKPLIEVAGKPMLGHIMDLFEAQGFERFTVIGGHLWEMIDAYLGTRYDCRAQVRDRIIVYGSKGQRPVTHLFNTGVDATTGDRLMSLASEMWPPVSMLGGSDLFLLTYGDGLCDIDLRDLVETHIANRHWTGKPQPIVTLTAVNPPGRFGVLEFDQDDGRGQISAFCEKGSKDWINGGFMVVDQGVFLRWVPRRPFDDGPYESFEEGALPRMAAEGRLFGHKHDDLAYWTCMDTRRDLERIERDIKENGGKLPWLRGT